MRRFPIFSLILSLCSLPPALCSASQWVSEKATSFEWKGVEDDHGGFYLVWTKTQGGISDLVAQHVGMEGQPAWTVPGVTLGAKVQAPKQWTAFPDAKGGLGIVWIGSGVVWAQLWDAAGLPRWEKPIRISSAPVMVETPVAVADASGGFFVVWAQQNYPDRTVLLGQHVTVDGRLIWNPEGLRISLRPSNQRQPRMISDGAAGFHVAWTDRREGATYLRIQRMNFQGFRLWGMEGTLVIPKDSPSPVSTSLQMAPHLQGGVHLAWAGSMQGHSQVLELKLNPKGLILPAPAPAESAEQWNPVLWGDGIGQTWMGWEDSRNLKSWQVYVRGPTGEVSLAPSNDDQGRLALAEDTGGGLWAAWIEKRTGLSALIAQRLDVQGAPILGKTGRVVMSPLKNPDSPALLPLLPDQAVAFWSDQPRKGEWVLGWTVIK